MMQFIGNRWVRSCDMCFGKEEIPFCDIDWTNHVGKGKSKIVRHDFNTSRNLATLYCTLEPLKDTLEEMRPRFNCWIMSLFPAYGKNSFFFTEDVHFR